mmetsp:Transcript_16589/g.47761  ORF Transcript_16589/g.47761 Transcript_16589/m.47761 type:complete len:102 (+) Transcript_16589:1050-1355(+)
MLHLPSLKSPLYSVFQHMCYPHCSFLGDSMGMFLMFPHFNIEVNDEDDFIVNIKTNASNRRETPTFTSSVGQAKVVTTHGKRKVRAKHHHRQNQTKDKSHE